MASDFTLVLTTSAGAYTFTYTPACSFSHNNLYNQSTEPPTISGVQEIWEITDVAFIDGTSETVATAYLAFLAVISTKATPVTKVELKKNGSTIHSMSTTTHTKFMVNNVRMADTTGRHANHVIVSFTIQGVKGLPIASGDGSAQAVTKLEQKLTFQYSRGGFLTKTFSGTLRTNSTGAEAAARLIGSQDLDDLGDTFVYETNGPEGVDVEVLSYPADNAASFRCVVIEQALAYPDPDVSVFLKTEKTHKTKFANYLETTVVVQATSMALAESVARDEKPANSENEDFTKTLESNTFTITYFSKAVNGSGAILNREYEFRVSGGKRATVVQEVLYGKPIVGKGSLQAFVVEETMRVLTLGTPATLGQFPPSMDPKALDEPSTTVRSKRAKQSSEAPAQDEYEVTIDRRYVFDEEPAGLNADVLATFRLT